MTLLHVYFHLRNQQAFQRLLERDRSGPFGSAGPSTSAGKSSPGKLWSRKSIASTPEVNAFDDLGRTVLHLVCSSTDASSTEYARMLLSHPNINVNLPDKENHWTALHRALYSGNIEAAILLLKHLDVDMSIKDFEGYTAFDLYNSTVWATKPLSCDERILADLFTWGTNRNAALGLGDANDRIFPDPVVLPMKDVTKVRSCSLEDRFATVRVCDVKMSKLHTVILTSEPRDNLWVCGFGSGGRLGPSSHTVYTPSPITFPAECSIVSVALGQDHTLALTDAGEVLSWGLNRFSQLGYVVETGQGGCIQEPVQSTPRKISQLKKEFIKGIAACKSASACWSNSQVWTWGTNNGQLGYDKVATPVQVFPRQVSVITEPVYGMAMSETVTSCLFISGEVVCIWHGGMSKVNFPAHSFPSEISVYRPPRAIRGTVITKIASCEDSFVALSSNGEVFTFSAPTVSELDGLGLPGRREKLIKPQRVWALRRQAGSVRDVDIGGDGTFIVCTRIWTRLLPAPLGHYVSNISRHRFKSREGSFEADMTAIMPFVPEADAVIRWGIHYRREIVSQPTMRWRTAEILDDISSLERLMDMLRRSEGVPFDEGTATTASPHDADIVVCCGQEFRISHSQACARRALPATPGDFIWKWGLEGQAHNLLALWDRRVGLVLAEQCKAVGSLADANQIFATDPLAPDVALYLRDKVVYTHSVVLRARCPFFSAFFGDKDWTSRRRNQSGVIDIRMDHFDWEVMQFVLGFICFGEEKFFDALDFLESADDVVEFMFRIVAAANELLLDRLVLLCSQVILGFLNPYNACYLLTDAIYYNAVDLVKGIENYMTVNLEMFLESRILDDLGALEVRHLAGYTRSEQAEKSPLVRSNRLARDAMEKHREWLANQDIPEPLVSIGDREIQRGTDLFIMDDMDVAPTLDSNVLRPSLPASPVRQYATLTPRPVWKTNPSTPRVDLKSIMVEAETKKIAAVSFHLRGCNPKRAHLKSRSLYRLHLAGLTNASSPSTLGPKIAPARQSHLSSESPRPRKAHRLDSLSCTILRGAKVHGMQYHQFAEIQLLQQAQGSFTIKDKRSFLDIQEEERARQQEEGFLRWWATEEERVKQELAEQERLLSQTTAANTSATGNHTRGNRRDRKMRSTESELFSTPKRQGKSCTSSASSRSPKTRKPRPCKESNHER
ncbi:hypothetical protein EV401DRAFT_2201598 [Pisolithus croceorrhizus]|nr:hypothetical protein EV401DRAFT_2201598 [Pisolithus croceorrhizus]